MKKLPRYLSTLNHTYHRFKWPETSFSIIIIPSQDAHIDCIPANFERSLRGLPYPKPDVFAQSLVDVAEVVDLTDLVDGMNLTEAWGTENLELDGNVDEEWVKERNAQLLASYDPNENKMAHEFFGPPTYATTPFTRSKV